MDLPIRSKSPMREIECSSSSSNLPPTSSKVDRWLDEPAREAPWVPLIAAYPINSRADNIRRLVNEYSLNENGSSKKGATFSRPRSPGVPLNPALDRIPGIDNSPSVSDGSGRIEEGQTRAGVLKLLSRLVAEVLESDDPTDGQDKDATNVSHASSSSCGATHTGKAQGKRLASSGQIVSGSQEGPQKQISEPKRLKIARSTTKAGDRLFACLFLKRDPNYCQRTHCAGRSTSNVETVIRHWLEKHVNQGDLEADTHQCIKAMKRNYNMSVPGQDEEFWIASYMQLFHVDRNEVPSPFVSADVDDDLTTILFNRLKENPPFATEVATFFGQGAAMRHRYEEGLDEIRRRYEAVEAQRIEQVKLETKAELTVATQLHEESFRQERENFNNKFKDALAAGNSSDAGYDLGTDAVDANIQSQGPGSSINDLGVDPDLQHQFYDTHPASDVNFSDPGYGSNERCSNCRMMPDPNDEGCWGCRILGSR